MVGLYGVEVEGERLGPHRMEWWWVARVGVVRPVLGAGSTVGECASPAPGISNLAAGTLSVSSPSGVAQLLPGAGRIHLSRDPGPARRQLSPRRLTVAMVHFLAPGSAPDHRVSGRSEGYTRLPRGAGEPEEGKGRGQEMEREPRLDVSPGRARQVMSGTVRRHFCLFHLCGRVTSEEAEPVRLLSSDAGRACQRGVFRLGASQPPGSSALTLRRGGVAVSCLPLDLGRVFSGRLDSPVQVGVCA